MNKMISSKPTSGPWAASHAVKTVFLKTDYFRIARHSTGTRKWL
jgi:hypothetical protein